MKTNIYLLLLALTLWGCSSDDDSVAATNLFGEWTWVQSSGGLVGNLQTPESIGATRSLVFTTTTLQSFEDGELLAESDYTLETLESVLFNEPREMLVTDLSVRNIVELDGQQLVLTGDCNDCVTSTYVKSNN
ncbi:MAG: hypothetical protein AAF039_13090 [Bacteroidota bacterium]